METERQSQVGKHIPAGSGKDNHTQSGPGPSAGVWATPFLPEAPDVVSASWLGDEMPPVWPAPGFLKQRQPRVMEEGLDQDSSWIRTPVLRAGLGGGGKVGGGDAAVC